VDKLESASRLTAPESSVTSTAVAIIASANLTVNGGVLAAVTLTGTV